MKRSAWMSIVMNLVALAVFWLLAFTFVQVLQRAGAKWYVLDGAVLVAIAIGLGTALRLRARAAAYLLCAFAAMGAAELLIHTRYGIRTVQGAPSHFAVLAAALLGVVLAVWIVSVAASRERRASSPAAP